MPAARLLCAAILIVLAFCVHGVIRSVGLVSFGPDLAATGVSAAFGMVVLGVPVAALGFVLRRSALLCVVKSGVIACAVLGCYAVGVVCAEAWLLLDDLAFAKEVLRSAGVATSRGRSWPFHYGGLVYLPGEGVHATD